MLKGGILKTTLWALGLAIVIALGWSGYRALKRSDLQKDALALVQDSTVLLREALGLVAAGAEIRSRLEAIGEKLEAEEARAALLAEAKRRLAHMKKTGSGIPATEVFAYLEERAAGKAAARPKARKLA